MVKEKSIPYENLQGDKNPAKRPEVKGKISVGLKEYYKTHSSPMKGRTGKNNPLYGKKHTKAQCKKQSEGMKEYWENNREKRMGKNHQFYGKTPKEWMSKEGYENRKKKGLGHIPWNKGLTKETDERVAVYARKRNDWLKEHPDTIRGKRNPMYIYSIDFSGKNNPMYGKPPVYPKPYYVEKLGHSVRSSWEEQIALLLKERNIPYEYEPRSFKLDGLTYTPDFIVDDCIVVEVKGYFRDILKKKYKRFTKKHPEYTFIIIGNGGREVCDVHIPWDEREKLIEILKNGEGKNPLFNR